MKYDDLNDITYMDSLKIEAVSRNSFLRIYANGKNQLPIEITAKVVKTVNNKDGTLNF